MVRQIACVYRNKEEDFHYISIRFTKKGIYTNPQVLEFLKPYASPSPPPLPPAFTPLIPLYFTLAFAPFSICLSLNMSHILQQITFVYKVTLCQPIKSCIFSLLIHHLAYLISHTYGQGLLAHLCLQIGSPRLWAPQVIHLLYSLCSS